ncbi:MAG: carboxypeptidase [Methylococcales bacterium]|nr:MAG: carboxypeptidase [Methylococcales bacterium]
MPRRQISKHRRTNNGLQRFLLLYIIVISIAVCFVVFKLIRDEVRTSKYQARYLSAISQQLGFKLTSGPSSSIQYPEYGPYDQRLGYTLLPDVINRLDQSGYRITSQASFSPMMTELANYGLFNIYHEKTQAGLHIVDKSDQVIFSAIYPTYGYPDFKSIPPIILNTLLFIENRELLNDENLTINPAIEWDRLGFASLQLMANKLGATSSVPGGSTLATQLEKYRHSKNGYTNSVIDKFRQMGTASLRAYMMGPNTLEMRQEIALSYLNSMPLAATPKLGEVHGLGDGLSAWFGADFNRVNRLLNPDALKTPRQITPQQAKAYRQVLNILLSQRRPSYLLGRGFDALQTLTDRYLRIMTEQGVISTALRDAALQIHSDRPSKIEPAEPQFFTEKKTQNVLRARLATTLGVKSNYDLDRLDLTVKSTLDYTTQQAVNHALKQLSEPIEARAAGILGFRMLNQNTDLKPIVYSLMLFEKDKSGNLLRIQTDNYDQPLDINEGIRIDLGSTSKFRTMVHYLELVTDTYRQYKNFSTSALNQVTLHPRDYISAWVIEQLKLSPKIDLESFLNLALDKRFSASPGEYFFTGGGLHHFNNFTKNEDYKVMSVRDALRDSVNLVFIRLMREIVYHHLYKPEGIASWLDTPDSPKRKEYLERFANNEGQVYLQRFFSRYEGKSPEEAMDMLVKRVFPTASRLTMLYRAIYPNNDEMALNAFLNKQLDKATLAKEDIYDLYDRYSVKKFDLQDQGYITKIHPLELWLVGYLAQHPHATKKEVIEASTESRQNVYRWLFNNHRANAQQQRIMTLLEEEAFNEIHAAWKRVGYPFEELTPSYATSIGASGDRPAALAELMGIVVNDGVKLPVVRFQSFHYAVGTPYETLLNKAPDEGERIFAPEIAKVSRGALIGVVTGGTASRLNGSYTDANNNLLAVGGKTGTGDHRKQIWGAGGVLLDSKFISRAATFTFFVGDRFFGVITAYVEGDNSGLYHFTSALPVQIVKYLKPILSPLINNTVTNNSPVSPTTRVISTDTIKPVIEPATVDTLAPSVTVEKPQAKIAAPLSKKPTAKPIQPSIDKTVVKVTQPALDKPIVKAPQPSPINAVVKPAQPSVNKSVVKVAEPTPDKSVVKVPPTLPIKPTIKPAQPSVNKTVVKAVEPTPDKSVVKAPPSLPIKPTVKPAQPSVDKTALKVAEPTLDKPVVKVPQPLPKKPIVKPTQPPVNKPAIVDITPAFKKLPANEVKQISPTLAPKTTKTIVEEKTTPKDNNDSKTRYYRYPDAPAISPLNEPPKTGN